MYIECNQHLLQLQFAVAPKAIFCFERLMSLNTDIKQNSGENAHILAEVGMWKTI